MNTGLLGPAARRQVAEALEVAKAAEPITQTPEEMHAELVKARNTIADNERHIEHLIQVTGPDDAAFDTSLYEAGVEIEKLEAEIKRLKKPEPAPESKPIYDYDPKDDPESSSSDTPEAIWERGLRFRASESTAMAAFSHWHREYGDWTKFNITDELVELVRQARNEWDGLLEELEERRKTPKDGDLIWQEYESYDSDRTTVTISAQVYRGSYDLIQSERNNKTVYMVRYYSQEDGERELARNKPLDEAQAIAQQHYAEIASNRLAEAA
jgi:hypothetical protein